MKINNEINIDDVNYIEIEEVDEITLYDSIDGWIDEPIYHEDSTAMNILSAHIKGYGMITPEEDL